MENLREQFENEVKIGKTNLEFLFEISNQKYIEWLEHKLKLLNKNEKLKS
jgi:hypothetical protein